VIMIPRRSIIVSLCVASLIVLGCGDEGKDEEVVVNFLGSRPPEEASVPCNFLLTLDFDKSPLFVFVNGTPAEVQGMAATWSTEQYLDSGPYQFTVTWTNQDASIGAGVTLTFIITTDCGEGPPLIVASSVEDGDTSADPESLNRDGITVEFDEDVLKGTITISPEGEPPLDWTAEWSETSVKITPTPGNELVGDTVYVIEIQTRNFAGDELDTQIVFITKA